MALSRTAEGEEQHSKHPRPSNSSEATKRSQRPLVPKSALTAARLNSNRAGSFHLCRGRPNSAPACCSYRRQRGRPFGGTRLGRLLRAGDGLGTRNASGRARAAQRGSTGSSYSSALRSGAEAIETLYPGFFQRTRPARWRAGGFLHDGWLLVPTWSLEAAATRAFNGSFPDAAVSGATLAKTPGWPSQCENRGAVPDGRAGDGCRPISRHRVLTKRSGEGVPSEAELMKTDLVVDASGRNSATPKWLESGGFVPPDETSVTVRIGYASRFYEAPPQGWKALAVYARAPVGRAMKPLELSGRVARSGDNGIVYRRRWKRRTTL